MPDTSQTTARRNILSVALAGAAGAILPAGAAVAAPSTVANLYARWRALSAEAWRLYGIADDLRCEVSKRLPDPPASVIRRYRHGSGQVSERVYRAEEIRDHFDNCPLAPRAKLDALRDSKLADLRDYEARCQQVMDAGGVTSAEAENEAAEAAEIAAFRVLMAAPCASFADLVLKLRIVAEENEQPDYSNKPLPLTQAISAALRDAERLAGEG